MENEIPRPTVAFFNESARELNLGRICPFEFDDGLQRELPEQTLLGYFAGSECEWLFMGSFWDRLQTAPAYNKTHKWSVSHIDNPWATALAVIVNQTIELLTQCDLPREISFYLHIYYDAHVPLMCALEDAKTNAVQTIFRKYKPDTTKVLHEGELPDIINLQLQCSFWNENKPKMQPIVHLMCKALPQRCQIRNLREIISNYCQTDDLVHEFMRKALLCSLLGMYKHCKKRMSWDTRKQIIRRFVYSKPNRTQMQEWLFTIYQHLLFYIIKEFLTYSMHMIPSLYGELCKTYKWTTFEKTVQTAMDSVRTTVDTNVRQYSAIQDWLGQIESTLMNVNKQQLGNLYRPQRQTFSQNILQICERMDEQNQQANPHTAFPAEYRRLMRTMSKRAKRSRVEIEWLQYFNVKKSSIEALITMQQHYHQNTYRSDLRKLLHSASRYDFEAIRELFAAFQQTHHDVRVFNLPQHYYDKQKVALRRRYGLENDAELEPHVGLTYLCLSCNSFKGFTIKKDAKCTNLFANGHQKIIVDDETLKCYCGKRCEKTDSKKRKRINIEAFVEGVELEEHRKRRLKKDWKTRRKTIQNNLCSQTECVQFNMTGCLLQFYGHMYLFCPSCGNPTIFHPSQYDQHGFTCGQCMHEGTLYTSVSCHICGNFRGKDSWTSVPCCANGKEDTVALCNACYKPWLRQHEKPIPKDVIEHQKQKYLNRKKNPK